MTVLTITAKRAVTLKQDLLKHLGVSPGERIEADKLPDGRIVVRAMAQDGAITGFVGCLAQRRDPRFTIDEINEIATQGMGEDQMKLTADSNLLIRAAIQDDLHQARRAAKGVGWSRRSELEPMTCRRGATTATFTPNVQGCE